ncbi:hypothetical protein PILCRDRAFT_456325 [Piloderma croceum F 1598]|uniref:MYND-type domain-containing protein n=1 Tax=Piloderma croceum (strain F 1598) TaxID=765440 RepID=A0A0C3FSW4_PILCF|nr:hypothetical protein PILCRDRAFT_456325 [Piloderma croceum F 1598]
MHAPDPESRLTSSIYDITPSRALQVYMTRYGTENENPDWDNEVLGPMNGDAEKLASEGLCHFRVRDNLQNTTNIDSVTDSLRIIGVLSFHPPIRYALANNLSFRIVTSVLTSITSQPYSPSTARAVCSCIVECCTYLICWLETANGVSGIQQALEAGLLSALVKSDPWLSKFDAAHSTMHLPLLSNVLPKYLIYRSVVRRVTKSLRNISMLGDEQKMVQGTLYWSAWSQFKQTAAERSRIDKEMEIGSAGRMLCSNKKCAKVDVKGAFMRCSGCKQSFYCSPSCQVADWKDGTHRTSCKEAQQRSKIDGMSSFFSKSDNEFITKVVVQEYKSRIEEIRQIRGSMKQADSLPLIVNLDYCCVPVKMTIGSPTTCRPSGLDDDEELRASWDAIIEKIEKRSKDIGLVYAVIPEGEATTCLMHMVDIPKNPDARPSPTPEEVKAGLSRIVREVTGSNPHAYGPGASEEERMKARAYAAGSRVTEALILNGMNLARKGNI